MIVQPARPGLSLLDIVPNPSDSPELAAILFASHSSSSRADSGLVAMLDIRSGEWQSEMGESDGVTCACWSVKGKQIALGLHSGEIHCVTPTGELKERIPRPPAFADEPKPFAVSDVRWIENHVFAVTYTSADSAEEADNDDQVITILRNPSSKSLRFVRFPLDPAPVFGGEEAVPKRHSVWLKGWSNFKHILIIGNAPSSDVGVIGCVADQDGGESGGWNNLELEETSRPTLPFSSVDSSADSMPVSLQLDLTSKKNVDDPQAGAKGTDGKDSFPPMPILYIYTNDGVLLGYHVIHTDGVTYPNMQAALSVEAADGMVVEEKPALVAVETSGISPAPIFATASAFGAPSAFGAAPSKPAFGSASSFGSTSAFGASSFGGFGNKPIATTNRTSASTAASSSGFGSFASKGAATAFAPTTGSATGFSFGSNQTKASVFGASGSGASSAPPFSQGSSTFGPNPVFGQSAAFGQVRASPSPFATPAAAPVSAALEQDTSTSKPFANFGFTSSGSSGFAGLAGKSTTGFGANASNASDSSIFGVGGELATQAKAAQPVSGADAPKLDESPFSLTSTNSRRGNETAGNDAGPTPGDAPTTSDTGFSMGGLDDLLSEGPTPQPAETNAPELAAEPAHAPEPEPELEETPAPTETATATTGEPDPEAEAESEAKPDFGQAAEEPVVALESEASELQDQKPQFASQSSQPADATVEISSAEEKGETAPRASAPPSAEHKIDDRPQQSGPKEALAKEEKTVAEKTSDSTEVHQDTSDVASKATSSAFTISEASKPGSAGAGKQISSPFSFPSPASIESQITFNPPGASQPKAVFSFGNASTSSEKSDAKPDVSTPAPTFTPTLAQKKDSKVEQPKFSFGSSATTAPKSEVPGPSVAPSKTTLDSSKASAPKTGTFAPSEKPATFSAFETPFKSADKDQSTAASGTAFAHKSPSSAFGSMKSETEKPKTGSAFSSAFGAAQTSNAESSTKPSSGFSFNPNSGPSPAAAFAGTPVQQQKSSSSSSFGFQFNPKPDQQGGTQGSAPKSVFGEPAIRSGTTTPPPADAVDAATFAFAGSKSPVPASKKGLSLGSLPSGPSPGPSGPSTPSSAPVSFGKTSAEKLPAAPPAKPQSNGATQAAASKTSKPTEPELSPTSKRLQEVFGSLYTVLEDEVKVVSFLLRPSNRKVSTLTMSDFAAATKRSALCGATV